MLVLCFALLVSCAVHRPHPRSASNTAFQSKAITSEQKWLEDGYAVWRLCPQKSQVYVLVGKTGPLKAFGHVHVIAVRHLRGFTAVRPHLAHAVLIFPVDRLVVDPPSLRRSLGGIYSTLLNSSARAGTRQHMLGPAVLDAGRYPTIQLDITTHHLHGARIPIQVTIHLHGKKRNIVTYTKIQSSKSAYIVKGSFSIKQTNFHIRPYSILLGALRIKNTLKVRYYLYFKVWLARMQGTNPC